MVDSPVGLLAWILDKFAEWTDNRDSPLESIPLVKLRVDVPAAITTYPRDIEKNPRPWVERRFRNIAHWQEPESVGTSRHWNAPTISSQT